MPTETIFKNPPLRFNLWSIRIILDIGTHCHAMFAQGAWPSLRPGSRTRSSWRGGRTRCTATRPRAGGSAMPLRWAFHRGRLNTRFFGFFFIWRAGEFTKLQVYSLQHFSIALWSWLQASSIWVKDCQHYDSTCASLMMHNDVQCDIAILKHWQIFWTQNMDLVDFPSFY